MEFDDCWASLFLASSPPPRGLSVSSCSCGHGFASRFFQLHLTAAPCGSATVTVISSGKHLAACKTTHMLGTLGAHGGAPSQSASPIPVRRLPPKPRLCMTLPIGSATIVSTQDC